MLHILLYFFILVIIVALMVSSYVNSRACTQKGHVPAFSLKRVNKSARFRDFDFKIRKLQEDIWLIVVNEIFKFPPHLDHLGQENYLYEPSSGYPNHPTASRLAHFTCICFYKQRFYKQSQAKIGKKSSKC